MDIICLDNIFGFNHPDKQLLGKQYLKSGLGVDFNGLSNLGVSLNNAMYQPMNSKIEIKDKDKEILNISEVEQFLGISGGEMYKIMDDIPHVSIGNKYLYSKRSLIDWVEKSNYDRN